MRLLGTSAAASWSPSLEVRQALQRRFGHLDVDVALIHRSERALFLPESPSAPYTFRAVTTVDGQTFVLVDPTETSLSIGWLIAHELRHQEIRRDPALRAWYAQRRPVGLDPAGDAFHTLDPEEQDCDAVATALLGVCLDRAWWRGRTIKVA